MVAQSMLNAGIEQSMADRFIENDINGPILVTLKFEDLRELDIPSFGIRTRVWHQIQALRDIRPASPRAPTPIEDVPDKEVRREVRRDSPGLKRNNSEKRPKKKTSATDTIMPGESVSIIGIEQVIPKPHHCSKGEDCSKYRKQRRLIEKFKKLNPNVDMNAASGAVLVYGDAGNPETAKAISLNDAMRPMSDAEPSVVASSDVLGTGGIPALQYLQEASARNAQAREAQANVRQFLQFQQSSANDVPPTPPFELGTPKAPHQGLRHLPRLSIPGTTTSQGTRMSPPRAATVPPPTQEAQNTRQYRNQQHWQQQQQQQQQQQPIYDSPEREEFVPYQMERVDPRSPDLETQRNPYRFGTPFSEMDVPVTNVNLGPVARDNSQSVPPDMNYHHSVVNPQPTRQRAASRASGRRPSCTVMPVLNEERPSGRSKTPSPKVHSPPAQVYSPPRAPVANQQPLRAPPRVAYPWSPVERTHFEQAIPPAASRVNGDASSSTASSSNLPSGVSFQGPMKKRKQKILRHEWQDGFFTIKGTRLNMHKDAQEVDRTLEYIDIDDYAIACSSVASQSKLSAAFKAVSISHDRKKSDPVGAFQFQLVPQDKNNGGAGSRLRKRDSAQAHPPAKDAPPEATNGTGKTHHFAVKNRDDRIDWMRELMLAKALKQKGEGFEISVNGSMI